MSDNIEIIGKTEQDKYGNLRQSCQSSPWTLHPLWCHFSSWGKFYFTLNSFLKFDFHFKIFSTFLNFLSPANPLCLTSKDTNTNTQIHKYSWGEIWFQNLFYHTLSFSPANPLNWLLLGRNLHLHWSWSWILLRIIATMIIMNILE